MANSLTAVLDKLAQETKNGNKLLTDLITLVKAGQMAMKDSGIKTGDALAGGVVATKLASGKGSGNGYALERFNKNTSSFGLTRANQLSYNNSVLKNQLNNVNQKINNPQRGLFNEPLRDERLIRRKNQLEADQMVTQVALNDELRFEVKERKTLRHNKIAAGFGTASTALGGVATGAAAVYGIARTVAAVVAPGTGSVGTNQSEYNRQLSEGLQGQSSIMNWLIFGWNGGFASGARAWMGRGIA